MLVLRFFRVGKKNQPLFKIVVTDKRRSSTKGRFVEEVGFYNPRSKEKALKAERIKYWLSVGAQPSPTVYNLLVSEKIVEGKKIDVHKKPKEKKEKPAEAVAPGTEGKPAEEKPEVTKEAPKEEAPKEEKAPLTEEKPEEKKGGAPALVEKPEEKSTEKPVEEKAAEEKPKEELKAEKKSVEKPKEEKKKEEQPKTE
jgi:small subunit ribosomal protein S16